MIVIYTDDDLRDEAQGKPLAEITWADIDPDLVPCAHWAEDVYLFREVEGRLFKSLGNSSSAISLIRRQLCLVRDEPSKSWSIP